MCLCKCVFAYAIIRSLACGLLARAPVSLYGVIRFRVCVYWLDMKTFMTVHTVKTVYNIKFNRIFFHFKSFFEAFAFYRLRLYRLGVEAICVKPFRR